MCSLGAGVGEGWASVGQQAQTSTLPPLFIPSPLAPPFPVSAPIPVSIVVESTRVENGRFPSVCGRMNYLWSLSPLNMVLWARCLFQTTVAILLVMPRALLIRAQDEPWPWFPMRVPRWIPNMALEGFLRIFPFGMKDSFLAHCAGSERHAGGRGWAGMVTDLLFLQS